MAENDIDWSKLVKSGDRVFFGSTAGVPNGLIDSLIANSQGLHDIEVVHMLTFGPHRWVQPEHKELFKVNTFFIGNDDLRKAIAEGRADYTPCFLSEISHLFVSDVLPLDVALVMVSPPDQYGYCSLGVSVDITLTAAKQAKKLIAQINPLMPRTCGQTYLHLSDFDAVLEMEQPLPQIPPPEPSPDTERIGQYVAMLVENGSTLQLGIGNIPESVIRYLRNHHDLGIHSEMINDGLIELVKIGVVNNRHKTFHPGKIVASFCVGTQAVYDFVADNPHVEFYPSSYVNKASNIARNHKMVSINSALEVDLTGQIVADSIGYQFYSGIGGQVDFVNGATMAKEGKAIIAMPSTAQNGTVSRIKTHITEGSGVVTSRGNVQYVVTEFGIASLKGKTIRERALELIRVAHPKFRAELLDQVRQHYWVPNYQEQVPMDVPELGELQVKPLNLQGEKFDLRPLNPADERRLQEFFYSHTKETLRLRYNYHPKQMSREKSCNLVSVDQSKDLALCIVKQKGSELRIEAVGRYYKNEADNSCEVAFVTREQHHGKGMAKTLLKEIKTIARKRGLSRMLAYVRAENKPMIMVFEQHGFTRVFNPEPQEIILQLKLGEEG